MHHNLIVIIGIAINCYQLQPAVAACQAWPLLPQDDQSRSSDLASRPPAVVCGVWNMLVMSLNLFMFDYKRVPLASSIVHKMSRFFLFKYILLPALAALPVQIQPLLNRPKLSSWHIQSFPQNKGIFQLVGRKHCQWGDCRTQTIMLSWLVG